MPYKHKNNTFISGPVWAVLLGLFLCISPVFLRAQAGHSPDSRQEAYARALVELEAFRIDSAIVILGQLLEELSASARLHSQFGLEVRMRQAEAFEKGDQDTVAIQRLLEIIEDSQKAGFWGVQVNAQLSVARLYEKRNMKERCRSTLSKAEAAVIHHELDSLYPRLCIRLSSYHRIFAGKDSALVYAQEVLRKAPGLGQKEHEATGHMLMGMLLSNRDHREAIRHFQAAAQTYKRFGNYCGYGYMMCNISKQYLKDGLLQRALEYNDSFRVAAMHAIELGQQDHTFLPYYYHGRENIFEAMGQLDSALYYARLGYEMAAQKLSADNQKDIVEVEARFKDEQKARKIKEQEQLLSFEKSRRNGLLGLMGIILFFMGIFVFLYTELKAANQKTERQSETIRQTNQELTLSLEQQIALQSEIHHRVKNNLQIIISLLDIQRDGITDPVALAGLDAMSNRIYSMSAIHEVLYSRKGTDCLSILEYTQNLCDHLRHFSPEGGQSSFQLELEDRCFNLETLMPIGIMLNEIVTNSLKYAGVPGQRLIISLSLQACGDGFCLRYQDNGPGFSGGELSEREGGLGAYLLKSMVRQLDGRLKSHNEDGAVYQIFFKEKYKSRSYEALSDIDRRG